MSRVISGFYTHGIKLTDPANNPVTITATGTIRSSGDYAIYGSSAVAWTITNLGSLTGSYYGIELIGGGGLTNGSPTDHAASISSPFVGVAIEGGGTVTNFGTIVGGFGLAYHTEHMNAAVWLPFGGSVINGSRSDTAASIADLYRIPIAIGSGIGTVVNYGSISAQGDPAVYLSDGGSVTNGTAGAAHAVIDGIAVGRGLGFITNAGTIDNRGVHLNDGGTVTNGAATNTGALIGGGRPAILISGGTGSVTNFGTIFGVSLAAGGRITNGSPTDTVASITLADSNLVALVTMAGRNTQGSNLAGAVLISGAPGTVVNFGTIADQGTSEVPFSVYLSGGGTVTNGAADATQAWMAGGVYGVILAGATERLTNFGTITSVSDNAVVLRSGGTVANGTALDQRALISGMRYGLKSEAGVSAVTNAGTIVGGTDGVLLAGGGRVVNGSGADGGATIAGGRFGVNISGASATVVNAGTIHGKDVGVVVAGSYGVVTNAGVISGTDGVAIDFRSTAARLTVAPGAVFGGRVRAVAGGPNVLDLAGGQAAGTLTGLGNRFVNFGMVQVDAGASWTLQGGNALAAEALVTVGKGGRLTVEGLHVGGSLRVAGPGTLAVSSNGAGVEIGTAGGAAAGRLTVDKGAQLRGSGIRLSGVVEDDGAIVARAGGALTLTGWVGGSGFVGISAGSVLAATGTLATAVSFVRGSGGATLAVGQGAHVTGQISGFGGSPGETIDLLGAQATGLAYAPTSASGGVLTVSGAHGAIAALRFAGSYATPQFHHAGDGHGGTTITFG